MLGYKLKKHLIKQHFIRFLKNHNAYGQYIHHIHDPKWRNPNYQTSALVNLIKGNSPVDWLEDAFRWESTFEGDAFWRTLDCEWQRYLLRLE